MSLTTRRQFVSAASAILGGPAILSACSNDANPEAYDAVAARTWRLGALDGFDGAALGKELVRYATLAPSSHNTQCWKFAIEDKAITIVPDLSQRTPAVDPDDHHLFVSLGCAAENLVQAALAHGLAGEVRFDAARNAVEVTLAPTRARTSPLFQAIVERQCTRGDYDGKPLASQELDLLLRAATTDRVRLLLVTERGAMKQVLAHVVQGNTAQMADPAFIDELKAWIRFNGRAAVRTGDGLYSVTSGNPSIPSWLGEMAFGLFFRPGSENDMLAHQFCSSAGIAVFVGQRADKAHWVDVGRCYERCALQATALGIRNAFLNQPVEVPAVRSRFADAMSLAGQRPDLVVRFGRGPSLPRSLRRL